MNMWSSRLNRNLSNCKVARRKGFRDFNGIRTRGLCVRAAVLCQPSYEDPNTGDRQFYWVQPVKKMKHRRKWCEVREYKWNEYVPSQRPRVRIPLKPRKPFQFRATSQLLKLRFNCDGHTFISLVFPQFTSFHSVSFLLRVDELNKFGPPPKTFFLRATSGKLLKLWFLRWSHILLKNKQTNKQTNEQTNKQKKNNNKRRPEKTANHSVHTNREIL